jgi:competence protein ComEC
MPYLALVLSLALTAGLAAGVAIDAAIALGAAVTLSASWTLALLAFRLGHPRLCVAALVSALGVAGGVLGRQAVDAALHTTLREALERRFGGFALDAFEDGRLEEPVRLQGRLRADAAPTESGVTLTLDVTRIWIGEHPEAVTGGVSLGVGGSEQAAHVATWTRGRVVQVPALLRRPARYLNAGLGDQERALARRGVSLVGAVKSAAVVELVAPGGWLDETGARVRARTRQALTRHVPASADTPSPAIAAAILIGDRSGLAPDLERRLQEAGTYHVIAISGGNIAVLAGTVLLVLRACGLRGRAADASAIVGIAAYAFVVEGGASVARASLMAALYLAVRLIDQRTSPANAIAIAGGAILLGTPLAVADVGFWLTFGATAGILVAITWAGAARTWRRALAVTLMATVGAEAVLVPVATTIFQRVTVAGLALNFVALPAMALVQLGALVAVFADALGVDRLARVAGIGVHLGCVAITGSTRLLDVAPWLTWRVPPPSPAIVIAYYAALVTAIVAGSRRRVRRVAAAGAVLLFAWMVTAPPARVRERGDGRLHVTMIDVGQGDAVLVTVPNGRRLLVDTGGGSLRGGFDTGERVIGPMLRARGILSLDYLAITHGDPDHIGGAPALVRDFAPREVWWGVPVDGHEPTARLREEAERQRAGWRTLRTGDQFEMGEAVVRVHHPLLPDWERRRVRNDDSLVLELAFRDTSVLLTGDIGREVELTLLPTLDLRPRVILKVAHHGSLTSTGPAFVDHVRPLIALVGAGRANPYGHPVRAVLDRLHAAGARVFRTDLEGQIDVVTDGREISVSTFTGTRLRVNERVTKARGHEAVSRDR